MKNMRAALINSIAIAMITVTSAHAAEEKQNCRWIETSGEAIVESMTPEDARQLSLNRARLKAVEAVSGVKIHGSAVVKDFALIADFVQSLSSGIVVEEKEIQWESSVFQEKKESPVTLRYKAILKTCVASAPQGDPYFKIKAELNRPVFVAGDEAVIKAACTKDCYLTIVNITADEKIKVLLPNSYEQSRLIKRDEPYTFPANGVSLEMHTLNGHARDTEFFFLIATKEEFDIIKLLKKGEDIKTKDFYEALLSLPPETKTEEILGYEVRQKE